MNTATETLLAFWEDPRNIPFKRRLISEEPPGDGKEPTTCMCAQGQALHIVGGYSEEDLRNTTQGKADREVARLLDISVVHSVLLRLINDGEPGAPSDVLTSPEKYLGKNCHAVMKFWWFVDGLSLGQWNEVASRCWAVWSAAGGYAGFYDTAGCAAVWYAAGDSAYCAAGFDAGYAAINATYELIEGIDDPVFVPLFADLAS
jgi:hypothetical protein